MSVSGEETPSVGMNENENEKLLHSPPPRARARYTVSRGCLLAVSTRVARWTLNNLLLVLTIASVVAGTVVGLVIREARPGRVAIGLVGFPGEVLLRMLKMLILPLIVFSLISGLGSLRANVAGSLGWKTLLYYFTTTAVAVGIGLLLVTTIQPGSRHPVERTCDNSTAGHVSQLNTIDSILDLVR